MALDRASPSGTSENCQAQMRSHYAEVAVGVEELVAVGQAERCDQHVDGFEPTYDTAGGFTPVLALTGPKASTVVLG